MKEYNFYITEDDNDSNGELDESFVIYAENERAAYELAQAEAETRFHGVSYKLVLAPEAGGDEEPPEND